jgi:hypothetical protein
MSLRRRKYVVLLVGVVLIAVYAQFTGGWSDIEYYGGAAVIMFVVGMIGMVWMEYAPDGAFRKHPET